VDTIAQFKIEIAERQRPAEKELGGKQVGDRQVAGGIPANNQVGRLQGKGGQKQDKS
jgi:hypothetical protein